MALIATAEYYDAAEIATRILPHLVVLTADPDGYCSFVAHILYQFIMLCYCISIRAFVSGSVFCWFYFLCRTSIPCEAETSHGDLV